VAQPFPYLSVELRVEDERTAAREVGEGRGVEVGDASAPKPVVQATGVRNEKEQESFISGHGTKSASIRRGRSLQGGQSA
jgi:hypothetical protein